MNDSLINKVKIFIIIVHNDHFWRMSGEYPKVDRQLEIQFKFLFDRSLSLKFHAHS